jgi:hypothetical protein
MSFIGIVCWYVLVVLLRAEDRHRRSRGTFRAINEKRRKRKVRQNAEKLAGLLIGGNAVLARVPNPANPLP